MSVTVLALLSAVAPALAADDKPIPPPKVGALVFAHYKYDLTETSDGFSDFGVDRAYLFGQGQINDVLGARVTIDADGPATLDPKMRVFLKHAWLEGKLPAGLKVRAGMVDTGWIPYSENFTNVRYITKQLADQTKLDASADLGVNLQGAHAKGLVDWHVGLYNGEGYAAPETDGGKAVAARVAVDPLAPQAKMSLPIVLWVKDHFANEAVTKDGGSLAYGAGLGFKMPYIVFWGEYDGVARGDDTSGSGQSITIAPRVPKVAELILRFDRWDPDADTKDDDTMTIIAGVGHNFAEKTSVALTYERTTLAATPDDPSHGVAVRWQAGF